MMNYDNGYDSGNKDRNDNDNAASKSGSDGSIFDLITMSWYLEGESENDYQGAATSMQSIPTWCTICLPYT